MSDALAGPGLVREMVHELRPLRGLARAIHEIARLSGLTERRVRGCTYGEVTRLWAEEDAAVKRAAERVLAERRIRLDAMIADTDRRIAALREAGL